MDAQSAEDMRQDSVSTEKTGKSMAHIIHSSANVTNTFRNKIWLQTDIFRLNRGYLCYSY